MKLKLYVLFFQFIILYKKYHIAKGISGQNVRFSRQGDFPMTVSIAKIPEPGTETDLAAGHLCTGTLISTTDIISVSHCLRYFFLNKIRIIAGSADLRLGIAYQPYWWLHYNEFAEMYHIRLEYEVNDILYIKIIGGVPPTVTTARLTNMTHEELIGSRIRISGWSRENNGPINYRQKFATLTLLSKQECDRALSELTGFPVDSDVRILCSFEIPATTVDSGDNGAPAMINQDIIAITVGMCPTASDRVMQIVMHTGLNFYKHFLVFLLNSV